MYNNLYIDVKVEEILDIFEKCLKEFLKMATANLLMIGDSGADAKIIEFFNQLGILEGLVNQSTESKACDIYSFALSRCKNDEERLEVSLKEFENAEVCCFAIYGLAAYIYIMA